MLELLVQSFADLATRQVLSILAGKWRLVDLKGHINRWLINAERRQRFFMVAIAQGVGYTELFNAAEYDDVTSARRRDFCTL